MIVMKVIKKEYLLGLLCFTITSVLAQNNTCILSHQLIKMQKSSQDDIQRFLYENSWGFNGDQSSQSNNYFDFSINYNLFSWSKYSNYNEENILLYSSNGKSNIVIYQSSYLCFNNLLNGLGLSRGTTTVKDDKRTTVFKENSITVEFREYKNDNSAKKYSILIYNTSEIETLKKNDEVLKKAAAEQKLKYDNAINEGDILYSFGNYESAKFKYSIASAIENNISIQSKIELCNKGICDRSILKGDSLYQKGLYKKALLVYEKSRNNCNISQALLDKIKSTENKILVFKIDSIQKIADDFMDNNQLDSAFYAYNAILKYDKYNSKALNNINKINNIKDILARRTSMVFAYKNTNPYDFTQFKSLLFNEMVSKINKSKEGYIYLNYNISFDTLGNNLSQVKSLSTSIGGMDNYLSGISKNGILKPYEENDFYLATQDNLTLDAKWSTQKIFLKSKSKNIYQYRNTSKRPYSLDYFINSQPFKYGKFVFTNKTKLVNGKTYNEINLVRYKTVGPEAAFLSLLMPGMGTLKVTYGKKGWGRLSLFLLSTAISIGSSSYSTSQYNSYLNATNKADMNKFYNNANLGRKITLASAVFSTSIYIYDFLWVFSKGCKNIMQSRSLKKRLRNENINIENQNILW
jgi:hypothetical protein